MKKSLFAGFKIPAAFSIVMLLAMVGCSSGDGAKQHQAGADQAARKPPVKKVPVAVEPVSTGVAIAYYTTTATLEAESHAELFARTTGVVRELLKEEGDRVEEGDILLRLEDDDQKLSLLQEKLNLEKAELDYERNQKMFKAGVLSDKEYLEAKNALNKAKANVEIAELNLSYTEVRSPFSGHVVRRKVDLGAQVSAGVSLFELMDVDPLLMRIHIPSNRMGNVRVGQEIKVKLDSNNSELTGIVYLVSPIVNPETGTVKITVRIDSYPEGTRPGDFAEVRVITEKHQDAMLVPSMAVVEEQGASILYVVEDQKAQRRVVEVGLVDSDVTEILSGVQKGDPVVVKGQRNLRDGIPIEIPNDEKGNVAATEDEKKPEAVL